MNARGSIARVGEKEDAFQDVYRHWDGYPTNLGPRLRELLHGPFRGNPKVQSPYLCDASSLKRKLPGADRKAGRNLALIDDRTRDRTSFCQTSHFAQSATTGASGAMSFAMIKRRLSPVIQTTRAASWQVVGQAYQVQASFAVGQAMPGDGFRRWSQ